MKFDKFEKFMLAKSWLDASNLNLLFKFNDKGEK